MNTRIVQVDDLSSDGIDGIYRRKFGTVTALAGQRQIVSIAGTALCQSNNVIDRKGVGRVTKLTQAVFTGMLRPFGNHPFVAKWN